VNRKKHFQYQIIYATNQSRRDAIYVIVIFSLMNLIVHVVLQNLDQNLEVKESGGNDDIPCNVILKATLTGT